MPPTSWPRIPVRRWRSGNWQLRKKNLGKCRGSPIDAYTPKISARTNRRMVSDLTCGHTGKSR